MRRKNTKSDSAWKIHKPAAKSLIFSIIESIEEVNNVKFYYNRICIRNQKTKWGSCSSKKNLNFNYKIIHLPPNLARYLVLHELCHLKYLNHSPEFWNYLANFEPNFKYLQKQLRNYNVNL